MIRTLSLADGTAIPVLGQSTSGLGDDPATRDAEQRALAHGLDLGLTLIDTAELYGDGRAEALVGEVIAGRRDDVFVVSKVRPENASDSRMLLSCEKSLERLGIDRIDLYLLHWHGRVPLEETIAAFEELIDEGMIARWGVSNFDLAAMTTLEAMDGGPACATNQVMHHLASRGVEHDLLPWMREQTMPLMAYSPLGLGKVLGHPAIQGVADRHAVEPASVALAALLRHEGVVAIPKASSVAHVEANAAAVDLTLDAEDWAAIEAAFPAPTAPQPLEII